MLPWCWPLGYKNRGRGGERYVYHSETVRTTISLGA